MSVAQSSDDAPVPFVVRISKIAGRYLVFDAEAVAILRRQHSINGTLVGTTPQQPTQNIFFGLPVELRPEEASILLERGVAYIADDVAAHRVALRHPDKEARLAYTKALERQKSAVQAHLADISDRRAAELAQRLGLPSQASRHDASNPSQSRSSKICGLTPTSSRDLISRAMDIETDFDAPTDGYLCRFLNRQGYHMTPGLRFGAQYSVYPGDPLRYHAHFMANEHDWHHEIPILDIVSGGRLATAVKKSLLLAGRDPTKEQESVFTLSIEWAAM
ncbi:hypothetical protein CDD82_6017 [Ophiocordyceps australis]|uniref:tRNA-splicing endonuclease subunit Sen34 n=1 Tax=Ophiocordyceps australis TaxID=1399860 RepID=A0A2C5YUB1_9HYPO|nr:hypothetical protein CDD82_6017 [Ophiocordyceps australis]